MSPRCADDNSKPYPGNIESREASDREDLDVVLQLQAGNHDALTFLWEKYSTMVFGIARRMLRDPGEAEEVVQQVFLDTFRAIDQFDPQKASYKTWLFQFAYHRTLNRKKHLESKGFYSREELHEQQLPVELYAGKRFQLNSPEVVQLVRQLLNTIQSNQRLTIELTFFEGLTAEEIAAKTGETPAAVRHHLYRGLAKLRTALLEAKQEPQSEAQTQLEGVLFVGPARSI